MVEEGNSCVAALREECVGLLTMLSAHWLVNETVWKKVSATSWRECLCGLRKTCQRKASADLPAKSHFKILSEPAFASRLSFLPHGYDVYDKRSECAGYAGFAGRERRRAGRIMGAIRTSNHDGNSVSIVPKIRSELGP